MPEGDKNILETTTIPFSTMWLGVGLKTLGSRSWLKLPAGYSSWATHGLFIPASGNMEGVAACFETDEKNMQHIFLSHIWILFTYLMTCS